MHSYKVNLLIADNITDDLKNLIKKLKTEDCLVEIACDVTDLLTKCRLLSPHVILLDLQFADSNGIDLLKELKTMHQDVFIIATSFDDNVDTVVQCMRAGAYDYIVKPYNLGKLKAVLNLINEQVKGKKEDFACEELLGNSEFITETRQLLSKGIASFANPILISGEKGSGKELIARNIHKNSQRKDAPLISFDCSQVAKEEHVFELFGFESRYGTCRNGLFSQADGGTIVIKEIAELDIKAQTKLIKYLERGYFKMVDGQRNIRCDVRVIALTGDHIRAHIQQGWFREELYYLLNGIEIIVPPLRVRKDDISSLTHYFLEQFAVKYNKEKKCLTEKASSLIENYYYPGNTKELKTVIEKFYLTVEKEIIDVKDLPPELREDSDESLYIIGEFSIDKIVNNHILRVLKMVGGNKKKAAQVLAISERALYYKLKNELQDIAVTKESG